ncbi:MULTISPECIES: purine-cytosine permease family protein [unclassified Gordonia (in: high G+C Gram-positive bacteria)]|uniref:purine-cytosine permease family protein n=1 Tax=unclassified Gordonia (in: high G+C Gram-positive bacteria) TaxID=2657482 RepID=UPI0007E9D6CE|nr:MULTISPECIES: cytosine permease [unclassified Gordonia (in: high G+C Gram-positive bacteria)]OBC04956.1 permease, nucleobase cation symporter-1 family (NCS1) [Gordonia sp. 852002-50395_SCH5434458]OBC17013.1 permease, nucleobase cation symporter-1 family (NCS1) [Gordonia sp. 852002-50816_SCH5313054-c]OBC20212.1 permease, nucleobase cation symporter-1 family (NCS1) [Gordonia sp. 852002-50816_SCH5313054-a]
MASIDQPPIDGSDQKSLISVEQRGIEHIPESERHGRPWQVGVMWSGLVLNVLSVVYGSILVALGLNVWQALLAIVLGNLTWIVTGVVSLAGPAAGTTTFGVSRIVFGRRGVRPVAFFNWIMMLGYEVLDLVVMVLAASALLKMGGVQVSNPIQVALVVGLSVLQAILPLLGHSAVTTVLRVLVLPFAAIFLIMAWLIADKVSTGVGAPGSLAVFLGGVALVASSSGLGWASSAADYSRYLPAATKRRRIVGAVTAGGAIPQMFLMALGVAIGIAMPDATDPVSGLSTVFPTWLVVIYLLLVIVQMVALNAVDLYSSGVTLQAMGIRLKRWQAVMLDGVICGVIGGIVVFSGDFYTFVNNFLLFMIIWFAPWAGIFCTDLWLRRAQYPEVTQPLRVAWSLPACTAQLLGMVAATACIHTSIYTGPLASALGGADLSVIAGLVVGAISYGLLTSRSDRTTPHPFDHTSDLIVAPPTTAAPVAAKEGELA